MKITHKSAIEEARSGGLFCAIIGLVSGLIIHPAGYLFALLGLIFFVASYGADK